MARSALPRTRTAAWPDLPRLRLLLAAAYAQDPLVAWTFPEPATRADAAAAWLGLFCEPAIDAGSVDVVNGDDGRVVAAAAWRADGPLTTPPAAPSIGGLLSALVGAEHASRVGTALAALRPHAPRAPSAYVQFLAVDPTHQRQGLGGAVLEPGLARAAADGLGVHLETANPAAVPFYVSRGLTVTAEVELPGGGPRLWVLVRGGDGR